MDILTRHLIRAHVGPFLFALSALTGLLFLNVVARQMEDLAGKGLSADVIVDFLIFSLPHTLALTLPMAVLVSVLYAFSEMASANEITAMRAGGISPIRVIRPLLLLGALCASVMLFFNDQVLPEANHRLKNLLLDINRKSPTFSLEEQVVNRIQVQERGDVYFLIATAIDNQTSELSGVTIVDQNTPNRNRVTRAARGTMAFNENRTDLFLTLYDGVVLESARDQPGGFQQVYFDRQIVPMRGVGNELERRAEANQRGERELTLVMLSDRVADREASRREIEEQTRDRLTEAVKMALGLPSADSTVVAAFRRTQQAGRVMNSSAGSLLSRDHLTQHAVLTSRTAASRAGVITEAISGLKVEIHKKYTLAVACLVFVLVGVPLATRFPRGGLGLVIAASSVIFAVYWIGLIGGEDLADRGIASPGLAMWVPNMVFGALGLLLFRGMGRETATSRGGGWSDLLWTLRKAFARWGGRRRPRGDGAPSPAAGTGTQPS